jgi:hypothetical protein
VQEAAIANENEEESTTQPVASKNPVTKNKQSATAAAAATAEPEEAAAPTKEDEQARPKPPDRPYRYLEERIRYVPCSLVNSEWDPLKASSIATIQEMLATAERAVFESVKDTRDRREHVGSALAQMSRRLMRQVRQVPFPPAVALPPALKGRRRARPELGSGGSGGNGDDTANEGDGDDGHDAGRGDELRFETVLDAAQDFERRLDPLKHSIYLLEAEKKTLAADIERQRKQLEQLTAATKEDRAYWRDRLHNAHRLAPYTREVLDEGGGGQDDDEDGGAEDEPAAPVPEFCVDDAVGSLYKVSVPLEDVHETKGVFLLTRTDRRIFKPTMTCATLRHSFRATSRACAPTRSRLTACCPRSPAARPRCAWPCSTTSTTRRTSRCCLGTTAAARLDGEGTVAVGGAVTGLVYRKMQVHVALWVCGA